jgi:hypothetical protein
MRLQAAKLSVSAVVAGKAESRSAEVPVRCEAHLQPLCECEPFLFSKAHLISNHSFLSRLNTLIFNSIGNAMCCANRFQQGGSLNELLP